MTYRTTRTVAAVAFAALTLTGVAGCGGDDDTPSAPAVTAQVPASASASVGGFISYLMALVAAPADTLQPVDISSVTPPTADNIEPTPIQ